MSQRLVYVRADDCSVCQEKRPVVDAIATAESLPLEVLDLGSDPGQARAAALRIARVPTLALVEEERARFRLVGRMITAENAHHLIEMYRG